MNLYYNGTDITNAVDIRSAGYTDRAGAAADNINLVFNDPENNWPTWNPQPRTDTIRLLNEGLDIGLMSIDMFRAGKGYFELGAVAIPQAARGGSFKVWEEISFSALLKDFADRWNLKLQTFGIPDPVYQRVQQKGEPDLAWLAARCMLESCILKITEGALVVFYVPAMEAKESVVEITLADYPGWYYEYLSHYLCAGVQVTSGRITGTFHVPDNRIGPIIPVNDIPALSFGEAERYAKGIARATNVRAHKLTVPMGLSEQYAAGQMVAVNAWGAILSGRWFIIEASHSYIEKKTILTLRRPLEGY